ncbi:BsuPI-related putative proteinase inhibitor [Halalkalibaculum sp. DA384]|uniref:BsuPI-related putative proteinase inhibitor n=1 Tax=Halalkalibaculum sp. DA384 TaxID=3373606 RepID=UPI0037551A5B
MKRLLYLVPALLVIFSCDNASLLSGIDQEDLFHSVKHTDSLRIELDFQNREISEPEDIEAEFVLENITDDTLRYRFSSGCQVGYFISTRGQRVFDSTERVMCTAALTKLVIEPGKSARYTISLEHFDTDDIQLEKGLYRLTAFLLGDYGVKITAPFVTR